MEVSTKGIIGGTTTPPYGVQCSRTPQTKPQEEKCRFPLCDCLTICKVTYS